MRNGYIKHWDDSKGYGFITPDDKGKDVFFHISKWHSKYRPTKGIRVQFDHQLEGNGKLSATDVIRDSDVEKKSPIRKSAEIMRKQPIRPKKSGGLLGGIAALSLVIATLFSAWPKLEAEFFHQARPQVTASQYNHTSLTGDINIDRTIKLIQQGGPYPYRKDGSTFYNYEQHLPKKTIGYYREFTVPTHGTSDRGARRIVTGGNPPEVYYYTADHYESFRKLNVKP